ncbi:hypothetical protein N7462_001838 [Penicillium macrosclerotiorum]|uniref:uncharacterized protein n=1 Tax=Penicillium macrosclerotiorum TaxID=303699 RepID=UPI0025480105|nr:uncharacterized protein N7462_001838 [Penicillium macrosclerotiorum]KAJ5692415.1 hypothetical protein N7462_001838 [Penicillium macrosclerotiorum]
MKSFAIAAILASTVAALPTNVISEASSVVPSNIPSCVPSGVIPSGAPLPSGIPLCSPSATPSAVASTSAKSVHSVLTVTNQQSKNVLVELEPTVASLLTGLNLGSATDPVGQIIQVADSVGDLNIGSGSGLLTVATSEGKVALVKLTSTVGSLLSSLGLSDVTTVVGSLVGTLESAVSGSMKRDPLSDVMQITGLNGNNLVVQLEPTVLSLVTGLVDLSSVQGTVGTVLAEVPAVSGLASAAEKVAADPTQLFGVLGEDGTSAMLVKVEGTAQGLLAVLGLSSLESTVGNIVSAGSL